jgi:hypothetical protein
MPLQKLQFRPGVNREGTTLANEGGWFECDKVRFRSGYPEKIGGWAALTYTTFQGVCRSLWNWVTSKQYNLLGVGTHLKFYIENGGTFNDVTPAGLAAGLPIATIGTGWGTGPWSPTVNIALGSNPIATTNASGLVTVTQTAHGYLTNAGSFFVGQEYRITSIGSTDFTLIGASANTVGLTFTATGAGSGSGTASIAYVILSGAVGPTVTAGSFVTNKTYKIISTGSGSTNFTLIGAANNTVGTIFTATGAGTGSGTAALQEVNGIPLQLINGTQFITVTNPNTFTFLTNGNTGSVTASATASGGGSSVVASPQYPLISTGIVRGWGGAYTTGITLQLRLWSQATFGDYLLFNPRGGGIYIWQPGNAATPNFAQPGVLLSSSSTTPSGWTSVVADASCPNQVNQVMLSDLSRIVIAFGCNDPSNTVVDDTLTLDPMLIRWSAQQDYANWYPDLASNLDPAGYTRLSHGSSIVAAIQTRQEIVVCTDSAVYSMQYIGFPSVWSFDLLADNISIASPNAIATANGVTYWMGVDKFYVYSGRVETLPCSLREYVFKDINFEQNSQIFAGTNEGYSEVWWFYCSANSDVIDRYVIFNHLDRVWYYGTLNRTAWSDSALRSYPEAAAMSGTYFTASITSNVLDVTKVAYGTITAGTTIFAEGVPSGVIISGVITGSGGIGTYSISNPDDPIGTLTVTSRLMSAVTIDTGLIVDHEAAVNDGLSNPPSPISCYIQSSDFDIGDGHNYGFVWQIIPDITFDGSNTSGFTDAKPVATFTVRPRQNPGSAYGVSNNPTVTAAESYSQQQIYNVQEFTEIVYTRVRGRQMAFKVSSNTIGTQWQLGTPRINIRPDGRR